MLSRLTLQQMLTERLRQFRILCDQMAPTLDGAFPDIAQGLRKESYDFGRLLKNLQAATEAEEAPSTNPNTVFALDFGDGSPLRLLPDLSYERFQQFLFTEGSSDVAFDAYKRAHGFCEVSDFSVESLCKRGRLFVIDRGRGRVQTFRYSGTEDTSGGFEDSLEGSVACSAFMGDIARRLPRGMFSDWPTSRLPVSPPEESSEPIPMLGTRFLGRPTPQALREGLFAAGFLQYPTSPEGQDQFYDPTRPGKFVSVWHNGSCTLYSNDLHILWEGFPSHVDDLLTRFERATPPAVLEEEPVKAPFVRAQAYEIAQELRYAGLDDYNGSGDTVKDYYAHGNTKLHTVRVRPDGYVLLLTGSGGPGQDGEILWEGYVTDPEDLIERIMDLGHHAPS